MEMLEKACSAEPHSLSMLSESILCFLPPCLVCLIHFTAALGYALIANWPGSLSQLWLAGSAFSGVGEFQEPSSRGKHLKSGLAC